MKKSILFAFIMAFGILFTSCDDKKLAASEVPAAVTAAFEAKYAGATDVEWKTEKHDGKIIYEAEFKLADKKIEAEFDAEGTFVKEEE